MGSPEPVSHCYFINKAENHFQKCFVFSEDENLEKLYIAKFVPFKYIALNTNRRKILFTICSAVATTASVI